MGDGGATRALLSCGVLGPPLFVGVLLIDGATRSGYDPWRHWVSYLRLGEQGWLGVVNLTLFGMLMLGFSLGLRRSLLSGRGAAWGPRLISLLGFGLILGGIFTIDPGLGYPPGSPPNTGITWHGQAHDLAGVLVFGCMTAVCFVFARRFAGDPRWQGWKLASTLAGATVAASFVACSVLASLDFVGVFPGAPSELFERVSLVTGSAWISLLAFRLLQGKKPLEPYRPPAPGR